MMLLNKLIFAVFLADEGLSPFWFGLKENKMGLASGMHGRKK